MYMDICGYNVVRRSIAVSSSVKNSIITNVSVYSRISSGVCCVLRLIGLKWRMSNACFA